MHIDSWMKQSGVAFGTSGVRGLVSAMTDAVCFVYTTAYLQHLAQCGEFAPGKPIALAGDLRPSTPRIMAACTEAIRHQGGVPIYGGTVPTPALCTYAFPRRIPSLMVTGSHIPADRNGIKFNRATGEFFKDDEASMRRLVVDWPADRFTSEGMFRKPAFLPAVTDMEAEYVARYRDFFGANALDGVRLGLYQHSAVGRDVLVTVFEALGATVLPLGRSERFVPVDTEAVRPEDVDLARQWAQEGSFEAIVTTDGDSDRPLLADAEGRWLRGDILGPLSARFLVADSVSTPVSSNTVLEKARFVHDVRRTRIGSPYVIEAMKAAERERAPGGDRLVVGYEANGGFLLQSPIHRQGKTLAPLPTRDAVLPVVAALCAAREKGIGLKALCDTLPARFTTSGRLQNIPPTSSHTFIDALASDPGHGAETLGFVALCGPVVSVDVTDGLRMTFADQAILHVRPSGNAPELRVYVEAEDFLRAEALLKSALDAVSAWWEGAKRCVSPS